MEIVSKQVKLTDLEKYRKELKRKHLTTKGFRVFKSNLNSAVYLVKNNQVKYANRSILRNNARTTAILECFDKLNNATY